MDLEGDLDKGCLLNVNLLKALDFIENNLPVCKFIASLIGSEVISINWDLDNGVKSDFLMSMIGSPKTFLALYVTR